MIEQFSGIERESRLAASRMGDKGESTSLVGGINRFGHIRHDGTKPGIRNDLHCLLELLGMSMSLKKTSIVHRPHEVAVLLSQNLGLTRKFIAAPTKLLIDCLGIL